MRVHMSERFSIQLFLSSTDFHEADQTNILFTVSEVSVSWVGLSDAYTM